MNWLLVTLHNTTEYPSFDFLANGQMYLRPTHSYSGRGGRKGKIVCDADAGTRYNLGIRLVR